MNTKRIAAPMVVVMGIIFAAAALILALQPVPAHAHDGDDKKDDKKTASTVQANNNVTYKYVAQPGDSYSKLARKAVQTYGLKYKVKLSTSQIVYAETNLTQEAGSPMLLLGQEVTISENTVKSWVEKARKLSKEDQAKWGVYVANVNFNTDNVGESR